MQKLPSSAIHESFGCTCNKCLILICINILISLRSTPNPAYASLPRLNHSHKCLSRTTNKETVSWEKATASPEIITRKTTYNPRCRGDLRRSGRQESFGKACNMTSDGVSYCLAPVAIHALVHQIIQSLEKSFCDTNLNWDHNETITVRYIFLSAQFQQVLKSFRPTHYRSGVFFPTPENSFQNIPEKDETFLKTYKNITQIFRYNYYTYIERYIPLQAVKHFYNSTDVKPPESEVPSSRVFKNSHYPCELSP